MFGRKHCFARRVAQVRLVLVGSLKRSVEPRSTFLVQRRGRLSMLEIPHYISASLSAGRLGPDGLTAVLGDFPIELEHGPAYCPNCCTLAPVDRSSQVQANIVIAEQGIREHMRFVRYLWPNPHFMNSLGSLPPDKHFMSNNDISILRVCSAVIKPVVSARHLAVLKE